VKKTSPTTDTGNSTGEIVVAQDGSAAALAAAGVAIQIAQRQSLSVHGLCVVDETLALDPYANYHRELENNGKPASRAELLTWLVGSTVDRVLRGTQLPVLIT
jgi:nucleotide-binding universal stress UspA family protein